MSMSEKREAQPPCFGDLEQVFPKGGSGLRQTPDACMACRHKTLCLRKAMADRGGVIVREEMVDRAYASGRVGFFERWSRKKALRMQQQKKDPF
jgi:hypothetical protein